MLEAGVVPDPAFHTAQGFACVARVPAANAADSADYDKSTIRTDVFACDVKSNSGMTIGFRVNFKSYIDDENWVTAKILVSQSAHL
jgi:hypothetical protein